MFKFEGRCKCGLTKYGMACRTLREHKAEMRVIWDVRHTWDLSCDAEEMVIQELGTTIKYLYFSPALDCSSDSDSDPEEELRGALAGGRVLVEAVGNIQELQRLHGELRRTIAKVMSLEAQLRSLEQSNDHNNNKCSHHNDAQDTGRGRGSRKRTAGGATVS